MPQRGLHLILHTEILDPSKPFIVEVDTSETGVVAVLSQRFGDKPKLNPFGLLLEKLSPAEWNGME